MNDRLLLEIKKICITYQQIDKCVLFGSRARGDHGERSDYDIAIYMSDNNYLGILSDIDDIDTLLKIDVTIIREGHGLSDLFIENVEREGVVVYEQI